MGEKSNPQDNLKECLLAEYQTLKNEQLRRLTTRDHIFYLTIAALAGALTLLTRASDNLLVLLTIPWLCLLLGWLHIVNDQKIVDIRNYIRRSLDPRLKVLLQLETHVFPWEHSYPTPFRKSMNSTLKRTFHFIAKLMAFVVPGVVALMWFFCKYDFAQTDVYSVLSFALAVFEAVMLILLALLVDRYIGIRKAEGPKKNTVAEIDF